VSQWLNLSIICAEGLERFKIIFGQTDIVALAVDDQAMKTVFLTQAVNGGGELELALLTHIVVDVFFEVVEDLRFDDVLTK
jgi:hypothetical protein